MVTDHDQPLLVLRMDVSGMAHQREVILPFAIGIEHTKTSVNVGTLLRSAHCFGAALVFTVGKRYKYQCSDTTKAARNMPVIHFADWHEFRAHQWPDWDLVAVECIESAPELSKFDHPRSAIYVLGPEDGNISQVVLDWPNVRKVKIESRFCLNVATAGSIVMWHRNSQRGAK